MTTDRRGLGGVLPGAWSVTRLLQHQTVNHWPALLKLQLQNCASPQTQLQQHGCRA